MTKRNTCQWPDEPCERPAKARGLCHRHWKTADYRGTLDHFERKRLPAVFDEDGRVCTKCGGYKPWAAFAETSLGSINGHRAHCRFCYNEGRRERFMREVYKITPADFDRMLSTQGHRCAICRTDDPRGHGQWHIDHDHVTGDVRGLLCTDCNTGIGSLKDDPDVLVAAAEYVRRNRQLRLVQ